MTLMCLTLAKQIYFLGGRRLFVSYGREPFPPEIRKLEP